VKRTLEPGGGKASRIYTDRYTPWKGQLEKRNWIVLRTIREGFRHNLSNRWVKAIVALAWVFTVVFPLLFASFGMTALVQDPEDAARFDNYGEFLSELDAYGVGFPLTRTIDPDGTATFEIWVANEGERPDILHIHIAGVKADQPEWGAWLNLPGEINGTGELNLSLPAGEMTSFNLSVAPPPGLVSGMAEVVIEAVSGGASGLMSRFGDSSGVTGRLSTFTIVGHAASSPYHFMITSIETIGSVKAGGSISIEHVIINTGTETDTYAIRVSGLPDGWKATIDGLDEGMAVLGPGESANFTVTFRVPDDALSSNYVAVVGVSMSDPSLTGGSVVIIDVTDIPDVDMTAGIIAAPNEGLAGMMFMLFTLFLAAVAGSKAISMDLAQKSYTVYFARPIGKLDYVAIKYGTVGAVLCMVTVIPLLTAYAGLILLSSVGGEYLIDHAWVWGAIVLHGLLIVFVMTSLSLAFSSLTKRRFSAAFGLVVAYFITFVVSNIIINVFNEPGGTVISIYDSVQLAGAGLFGVDGVDFDYSWGYNVLSLLVIGVASSVVVLWKVKHTELSE